jgi:hypothetical protein
MVREGNGTVQLPFDPRAPSPPHLENTMLKGIGIVTIIIFLIGLAVVIGLLKLIF